MQLINRFLGRFSKDLGIDLGTANTVVFARGEGIILREPSVVAIDKNTRSVMAIGEEAYSMVGRTPGSIVAVRPMKDGVIADFEVTEKMIQAFIQKAKGRANRFGKIRVLIGVPWGITSVEKGREVASCHLSSVCLAPLYRQKARVGFFPMSFLRCR